MTALSPDGTSEHPGEFSSFVIPRLGDDISSDVKFHLEIEPSDALKLWVEECYKNDAAICRKNLSVSSVSRDGSEVRTFDLINCYPTRFTASAQGPPGVSPKASPKASVTTITFTVSPDRIEFTKG